MAYIKLEIDLVFVDKTSHFQLIKDYIVNVSYEIGSILSQPGLTIGTQSVIMRTIRIRRRGRRGHDRMVVGLLLPMKSVPITTNVVSSNHPQAIQHYVIKFVSDLRQVGCFLIYTS
jgi:hypothetical protein